MMGRRQSMSALASEWLYRRLLVAYPAAYRERFAAQMIESFREACGEEVSRRRWTGIAAFWGRELRGLIGAAGRARWEAVDGLVVITSCGVFAAVLGGYVWTLAPTVTFWDAGEFIAASHTLGIPHPPGTPVFVFLSNVWARLIPVGDYAFRLNLMTACFSAAAAVALFLVVHYALRGTQVARDRVFEIGGAVAATMVASFTFTVWQNSNETELYMLAAFSIAMCAWLAVLWRKHRGTPRAYAMLLLIVYMGAISVGTHLLALLVGPAILGFMWHVLRTAPLENPKARAHEWACWVVLGSLWAVLIGAGLGYPTLFTVVVISFLLAGAYATSVGNVRFVVGATVVAAVGVSSLLFLYIRAGANPSINMADPSTWDALLSVIAREQYPERLPTDNPLYLSGAGNPGRPLSLLLLQVQNYLQYFDWQWSQGLAATEPVFAKIRLPFTLLFTTLGIYGAQLLRDRDRSVFWLLLLILLATGPALVGYMNFKPGFSIGFDRYPDYAMHEVRERDYFFVVSFQVWGLFAGLGVAGLYRTLRSRLERRGVRPARQWALPVFALASLPFVLNFRAADRAHTPAADLAKDFGYNLLQTVEPYGIVFTGGDNDTYPVLYAQQVEAIRPDVTVVVLPLTNTQWYIRQLRDNQVAEFDPEWAPWFADLRATYPTSPVVTWTDEEIVGLRPVRLARDFRFAHGVIDQTYPAGTALYVQDILTLRVVQENLGKRPIYFSTTAGSTSWVRLGDSLVQEGLAFRLYSDREPDPERLVPGVPYGPGVQSPPVDLARTDTLAWDVYRYAGLFEADTLKLDSTSNRIALNLRQVFLSLANAYDTRGDRDAMLRNLHRVQHLAPTQGLRNFLDAANRGLPEFADTPLAEAPRP